MQRSVRGVEVRTYAGFELTLFYVLHKTTSVTFMCTIEGAVPLSPLVQLIVPHSSLWWEDVHPAFE